MSVATYTLRSMPLADIAALDDPAILYDHIIVSKWGGLPNYECPVCMYADLNRDRTHRHIQEMHVMRAIQLREEQSPKPIPPGESSEASAVDEQPTEENED